VHLEGHDKGYFAELLFYYTKFVTHKTPFLKNIK